MIRNKSKVWRALAVGVSVIGLMLAAQSTAGASPTKWTIEPSPNVGKGSQFYSVSCITSTDCFGVGYDNQNDGVSKSLIEQWNGTHWAKVKSPNVGNRDALAGIDCVGPTYCIAVGQQALSVSQSPLVETWDGSKWSVLSSPNGGGSMSVFTAVSCVDSTDCLAVGGTTIGSGESAQIVPLIEWLNDGTWTQPSSPTVDGGTLDAVSCNTTTNCTAVGSTIVDPESGAEETLAETLSASTWTVDTTPDPGTFSELHGVYCSNPNGCIAVGAWSPGSHTETLVTTWDGSAWSVVSSLSKGYASSLDGISCISSSDCVAVGSNQPAQNPTPKKPVSTLVESWDGTTWSMTTSPSRLGSVQQNLASVSCANSASCMAIGVSCPKPGSKLQLETLAEAGSH